MKKKKENTGLMFPKAGRKKRRKSHPPSLIPWPKGICFLCVKLHGDYTEKNTEEHHVFFGEGLRDKSEQNGFKCNLCREHHREGDEAVHNNQEIREYLCRIFQAEYEKTHTREDFMKIIGKNYLED